MAIRNLEKSQSQPYFEQLSRQLLRNVAEVEVTGLGLRPPAERAWTPLMGVAYDPAKDTFQLVTEDLDHLIPHPQEFHIDAADDGLHGIEVVDAEGCIRTVRLRTPLPLGQDG
jgi:hypothetical protein